MPKKNGIEKLSVKNPELGKVAIGPETDFVYVMRKDGEFSMSPIANRLGEEHGIPPGEIMPILISAYEHFFLELTEAMGQAFAGKGEVEFHVYDPDQLEEAIKQSAGSLPLISLDPLVHEGVFEHQVSRGYYLGGKKDFGQVNRPGSESLDWQSQKIAQALAANIALVCEDDVFSGGSLIASLMGLLEQNINIGGVISGIQVGKPAKLIELGIDVNPIVEYLTSDGADIFSKLDLGDPRDYIVGASGLVVKLPGGGFGRAPYLLPFVSPSARASIPSEKEFAFSQKMLQNNLKFFLEVTKKIGQPVLLKHMDPHFCALMTKLFDFPTDVPMTAVVEWSLKNMDSIWKYVQQEGLFQQSLDELNLPDKILLLDVNGTLFSDDSSDGFIPPEAVIDLKKEVSRLSEAGWVVGLCSDSPLDPLLELSSDLGLSGLVIAENGSMIAYQEKSLVTKQYVLKKQHQKIIEQIAVKWGWSQVSDCFAPEFGGKIPDFEKGEWAFGEGRETSITVFGPPQFIEDLGRVVQTWDGVSSDIDTSNNFLGIHPVADFRQGKAKLLAQLAFYGKQVLMVGNSQSDWVDPATGVECAFVGGARIDLDQKKSAKKVVCAPTIQGVIQILRETT